MSAAADVLRIGNCSGFFGDRTGAAREMVEGGPLDVLTGDWLAELTMYILHKTRQRSGGYARTFLRELEDVLPTCVERGITVVSNAGGLQPEALAAAVGELARRQGLDVHVASVSGDDITPQLSALQAQGEKFVNLDTGEVLSAGASVVTANAYLRARPIADALAAGAQVVVTGRVTDAALVVGPALHRFGWSDGDLDAIAGAVVAGHVIECGAQCCGGNYAFFEEMPDRARIGFPLAELSADGSSVITKHPGTGGMVTVGTVTAQLLYEISGPRYLSPDAVARFDTISLAQEGPDRVRIGPVRGEAPPATLKVTANLDAGWRNAMTLALTGAQVAEKARFAAEAVWAGLPGGRAGFAETAEDLSGDLTGGGMAYLRLAVRGDDEQAVGRAFSGAVVETSLSSYPGTFFTSAPSGAQGVARYWPTTVSAASVTPRIECDGRAVPATPLMSHDTGTDAGAAAAASGGTDAAPPAPPAEVGASAGDTVVVPLWVLVGARSGDKGGDANVGVWADDDAIAAWLEHEFSVARFKTLLPEVEAYSVSRYPLPNLRALNFVVHGLLGWGVASNLRLDTQAKGLGELLRSRPVEVPATLVASGPAAARLAHALTSAPANVARASGRMAPVESAVRLIALIAGIALVVLTAWSVFTALVVPRVTSSPAMRMLARALGGSARAIAPKLPNYEARDRVLSFVGPAAMVMLFVLWLGLIVLGVALIEWDAAGVDFATALGISGSSVFTLGIVSSGDAGPRVVEVVAAGTGLLVVALEIAYLPTLYTQFSTRETEVTLLEARSGNPAWGPEILARSHWLDTMDELPPLYSDWERWAAAVSESHANYPALIWFRSPVPSRSWLVGLVAMMDSAALYHAVSPAQTPRQARLCLAMGINCLRSMARALRIPYDPDPLPTASVRLSRKDFDEGFRRLESVNFPAERSADDAWLNFKGWRVNYEPIVDALTAIIVPPPAPWFIVRPRLGMAKYPLVLNRTPEQPAGAQGFGVNRTFKTPSARESNNS